MACQVNMLLLKISCTSPRLAPFHDPFSPGFSVPLALRIHSDLVDVDVDAGAAGVALSDEATPSCANETVFPAFMPRRVVVSVGIIADDERVNVRPLPADNAM